MKIINTETNETVATIIGGNNLTLDEAIELVGGEVINEPEYPDDPNVIINGVGYWWDLLDTEVE